MARSDITAQHVRELLDYDHETGIFVWKTRGAHQFKKPKYQDPWNRRFAGAVAGHEYDGYIFISLERCPIPAHRLAWLHFYGTWPSLVVDHINGIRSDNRIANLRDVSVGINSQNISGRRRSPNLGVTKSSANRYMARIRSPGGRSIYLGSFKTAQEAHSAYISAKREMHPGNTL